MTVSNVYGHPDRVAPATRRAVLQAAEDLGYAGPSPAGRTLRRGTSGVIGLLVGDDLPYLFTDPGAAAFMQGMATAASDRDLSIQIIHASGSSARRKVHDAIVDSWITFGLPAGHPALEALLERRQRIVTAPGPRLKGHPMVTIDAVAGARSAVEHLLSLGHRDIVVFVPPTAGSPTWHDRASGARLAAKDAGLPDETIHIVECTENSRSAGRVAAQTHLIGPMARRSIAVFAATDVLALGVLDAARAARIKIPRDLSVVGFDDIDEAASAQPPLTTVRQDLRHQGAEAVELAACPSPVKRPIRVSPTELVIRMSTAAPTVRR